jgi:hypothetical protein
MGGLYLSQDAEDDQLSTSLYPFQRITGGKLPALHDTYNTRCHRKAKKIIKDNNHPSHCLFTPLPSRRRGQYRCIKAGTERLKNSLYLKAIRVLNRHHKLRKAAVYIETQSLATLINGSLVTLNNATLNNVTLIMFTYLTLLISSVYTVFYTIYCTLPMSLVTYFYIHIFSFTPLDLCVSGSC